METPTNIVRLRQPEDLDDPLTEVLRAGARRLLAQAVEMEADAFLSAMQDLRLPDGRARLVRHGHGPEVAALHGAAPGRADRGALHNVLRLLQHHLDLLHLVAVLLDVHNRA